MKTKKEIKALFEAGKLSNLVDNYIITNETKSDIIDALYLLFKAEKDEYIVKFESLPYSRGGKYARHTSTLTSIQRWEVLEYDGNFYIHKSSTSHSANCPDVVVPKFYTETGKSFFNSKINYEIEKLRFKLLK